MNTLLEDIKTVLRNNSGIATYSLIYSELSKIRCNGKLLTDGQKAGVRKQIEICSSDSKLYAGKNDIFFSVEGLGKGMWGLREYFSKKTEVAFDFNVESIHEGNDNPSRKKTEIYRILRDTELSKQIKSLYDNVCQICGNRIKLKEKFYSEAHHIKPLGYYNGPDVFSNLIVVCPNCHVKLDYAAVKIQEDKLKVKKHKISEEYINFHNDVLFNKKSN